MKGFVFTDKILFVMLRYILCLQNWKRFSQNKVKHMHQNISTLKKNFHRTTEFLILGII